MSTQIPESMRSVWDGILQKNNNGKISNEDYTALGDAANADGTITNEETNFLKFVETTYLDSSGEAKKGSAGTVSFVDNPDLKVYQISNNQIPASMLSTWKQVTAEGKLDESGFEKLKQAAAPSQKNEEFNDQELEFLGSLLKALQENNNVIGIQSTDKVQANNENQNPSYKGKSIPQSLTGTWNQVTESGKLDANGYEKLLKAAAPGKKNEEFDEAEIEFLKEVSKDLQNNNNLIEVRNTPNSMAINPAEIPVTLGKVWEEAMKDGSISEEDMANLVSAAAPNGTDAELDEGEYAFLLKVREMLNNGNNQATNTQNSSPVLLNWPGYTAENKSALRSAFQGLVQGNKMPLLKSDAANQIAAAFGQNSVQDLQKMVGAKVDGAFGPETFFKAKAFIANIINKTNDPSVLGQLSGMLGSLGNDPEVEKMKQKLSGISTNKPVENNTEKEETKKEENISVNLQGIDPNNKDSVSLFQTKLNILNSILEKTTGQKLTKSPEDGSITSDFGEAINNFQTVTGKSAEETINELDNKLKDTPHGQLDGKSAKFIHFGNSGFDIISNPVNLTRIESAKILLEKVGIDISTYDLKYPEDKSKDGDVQLVGKDFNLKIWDNFQEGRGHNQYGDLHVEGNITGKNIDLSYWENNRRGDESISKEGLYHIRLKVDGQEQHFRDNEGGFLPRPLAR